MDEGPLTIIHGDALNSLKAMGDESVQCAVTSPPYWSLRDYGVEPIIWDGDPNCDHTMRDEAPRASEAYGGKTRWQHVAADAQAAGVPVREQGEGAWQDLTVYRDSPIRSGGEGVGFDDAETTKAQRWKTSAYCIRCGAWRGGLGLEPTPELYVQHLVEIFREVRRVLKRDGTLWLNLGDCYSAGKPRTNDILCDKANPMNWANTQSFRRDRRLREDDPHKSVLGLEPKNLVGIPWRVAFALQADGWYLRSDIIWSKPNPMPESVTDRPTKSHEYIFLLAKSQRYFYDANAIREPHTSGTNTDEGVVLRAAIGDPNGKRQGTKAEALEEKGRTRPPSRPHGYIGHINGHNKRSVWEIPTAPFPEAHFATFPPDLVIPCVLAGTSARGCCTQCGAPWARVVEKLPAPHDGTSKTTYAQMPNSAGHRISLARQAQRERGHEPIFGAKTIDWKPTCEHPGDPVPCVVMDPFGGSGTVGKVAIELGRKAILIEPKAEYIEMIKKRCTTTIGLPI